MSPVETSQSGGHTILLGGVGGDAHSVGLTILRQALAARGYHVRYLGTQNRLEDFFQLAPLANAVMISSLDGHTRYYLRDFPELVKKYRPQGTRWYLGGNLHIGDACGYEALFREMGFDRVFVNFVDVTTVLHTLEGDLHAAEPRADVEALWGTGLPSSAAVAGPVCDGPVPLEEFSAARREVLESWKTGRHAQSLADNADFLSRQPSWAAVQARADARGGPPLIHPRTGVALVGPQIKLLKAMRSAGADVLSYQVDSLTRNNNYAGAEEAIRESRATGASILNGFPVINHGVASLRRVSAEVGTPLQTRHSTRDPRLLAEISYAGGVTGFEGGAVCYNIPYYKDYPLEESIPAWQYVDRLTGLYHERFGVKLEREFFGTLTATLIPPCLAVVVNLVETILAVQQGVKCVSLGYAEQGHRAQDVAAVRTLREMAEEVLGHMGYRDVQVNTVFHQYMAAFPEDAGRAEDLIRNSAATAALSRATRVVIKTPVEALRIPSLADNVHAAHLVRRGFADAARQELDEAKVAEECDLIRREARAVLDSLIVCGGGSVARGVVEGFRRGFLDVPFAPSVYNRHEVLTARDCEGAVRFLSCGQLQFDRELRQFHEFKLAERMRAEGLRKSEDGFLLVERDVLRIPRGQYDGWPLDGASRAPRAAGGAETAASVLAPVS
jgi:methylaspartate mutase epsilon subunit